MLEKEVEKRKHSGCPNRGHCKKDESKCCYLLWNNTCYLDTDMSEEFL